MTPDTTIIALLATPLSPDWTVEGLAEQLLHIVATQSTKPYQKFALDADTLTDRQTRRVLRPLLACLATMSAAEAGIAPDLYGGNLLFKRPDRVGQSIWIKGQFENRPDKMRVVLEIASSPFPVSTPGFVSAQSGLDSRNPTE